MSIDLAGVHPYPAFISCQMPPGAYAKWGRKINRSVYCALGEANSTATDAISNIRTVRGFSTETRHNSRGRAAAGPGPRVRMWMNRHGRLKAPQRLRLHLWTLTTVLSPPSDPNMYVFSKYSTLSNENTVADLWTLTSSRDMHRRSLETPIARSYLLYNIHI